MPVQTPHSAVDDLSDVIFAQAHRLLADHVTIECLAAADKGAFPWDAWNVLADAGFTNALVSEACGGAGLDCAIAAQLIKASGFYGIPAPFAETLIAQALWTEAGGSAMEGPIAIPVTEECVLLDTVGTPAVSGRLSSVGWAVDVKAILLQAVDRAGMRHLVMLPRVDGTGASRRNLANEPRSSMTLEAFPVDANAVRPAPAFLRTSDGLLEYGAFARSLQMVGAMERSLAYALEHANERKQFGKPIGRFQAVQNMLAQAAGEVAAATAATQLSSLAWRTDRFAMAVAISKSRCGEAAGRVAEVCHQVHGAMGFTHEHPLHFFTRRLWAWRDEFGNETLWNERLGRGVLQMGGDKLWAQLVALRVPI